MRPLLMAAVALLLLMVSQSAAVPPPAPVADCGPLEQPVGLLEVEGADWTASGSAWLYAGGYVITAGHVVEDVLAEPISVRLVAAGGASAVEVLAIDEDHDLALLSVPEVWADTAGLPLAFGAVDGEPVWAVGHPMGGPQAAFRGPVDESAGHKSHQIPFDTYVISGMSGGALLRCRSDASMESLGSVTSAAYDSTQGVPFTVSGYHSLATEAGAILSLIDVYETEKQERGD